MEEDLNQLINFGYAINYLLMKIQKVKDHGNITGKYRGYAHSNCNINLKLTKIVTVIFHNLRGYDVYLILQENSKFDTKWMRKMHGFCS